jgi:hypothetical protein
MKSRPDAFGTAENEFGKVKHEKATRRPRYRQKRVQERTKHENSTDALGTAENESGSAKHENRI